MNNLITLTSIVLLFMVFTSCGKNNLSDQSLSLKNSSIIVGDLDWKNIEHSGTTSTIFAKSLAVGKVNLPMVQSRCTGFLISEDVLMTNQHCVPTKEDARGISVSFDFLKTEDNYTDYICDEFLGNNKQLDFALLKCEGKPGKKYGYLRISDSSVSLNDKVYVIQQNCDYYTRDCDAFKKFSIGKVVSLDQEIAHDADTLGGSSGSPVFSLRTNQLIGLHHAGYGNDGRGRGIQNYAVPMSEIYKKLKLNYPSLVSGSVKDPTTKNPKKYKVNLGEMPNKFFSSRYREEKKYYFNVLRDTQLKIKVLEGFQIKLYSKDKTLIAKSRNSIINAIVEEDMDLYFVLVRMDRSMDKAKIKIKTTLN